MVVVVVLGRGAEDDDARVSTDGIEKIVRKERASETIDRSICMVVVCSVLVNGRRTSASGGRVRSIRYSHQDISSPICFVFTVRML